MYGNVPSRRCCNFANVSRRLVDPGWPVTKTRSFSAGPVLLQRSQVLRLDRLAVLVGAEETDVETEARILEVIHVATERRDTVLGRHDEPHVGVFLVAVQMIFAALIECDHVATEACFIERNSFSMAAVIARRSGECLGRLHLRRDCRIDALGHVFDGLQHVQFKIGTFQLFVRSLRVIAVVEVILVLGAELLQRVGADVVVGDDQAVRRDETAGAAAVENAPTPSWACSSQASVRSRNGTYP